MLLVFQGGMRILHVYAGPFPSHQGTQVYLRGLLGALAERGHQVALRCWHGGSGPVPEGVDVRRLRPTMGGERLTSGPHSSRLPLGMALWRALRQDLREPWDVVHAHHVEAPLIARLCGATPLVHHLHTSLAEELPTYASAKAALGGPGSVAAGAVLDRACVRAADAVVALSDRGQSLARRWGASRVMSLPPGLERLTGDAERGRERFGIEDRPWVAYIGNLDAYQDLGAWLEQAADAGCPVLLVTPDDPAERLRGVRLPEHLAVARTRDFSEQLDALACAAVAVVPRRRCAGVPMKLMTSLGMGLPTLCVQGAVDPWPGSIQATPAELCRAANALRLDPMRLQRLRESADRNLKAGTWADRACELEAFYAYLQAVVTPRSTRS
ncbi:MAG: glycosyltransferase [Myxococcota bacterium]